MPKILKDTIKKIPSKQSLRIYRKSNSPNYYCSFYVGYSTMKSGKKEKTLRTKNVKEALKITGLDDKDVANYDIQDSKNFSTCLRKISKPTLIVANKIDVKFLLFTI